MVFTCSICKIFKNNYFEEHLQTTASVNHETNPDIACNEFMHIISAAYGTAFPDIEIKIKIKTLSNP